MSLSNSDKPGDVFTGKRYIALVRASNDADGSTSTDAQLEWMHDEGRRLGMRHVDDEVLSGVTGSLPGRREDLARLLHRRAEQRDFDVLLVQRCDRLSRGGGAHTLWFIHETNKVGLIVHFAGDDIPPPDATFRNTILSMKADAAQEQAKAISQRSVQGSMYSIDRGLNCVVSRTPFGCDRLYLTSDGRPQFIIRNLGDGRQQKLHHETGAVIDSYGRVGGGNQGHYDKQKDEQVLIVPGAPEAVKTVRLIFDLHYNQRQGGKRIADVLNQRGIALTGKEWSQRQVERIYENPIYCGVARGRGTSQGIYFTQGDAHPEAVRLDTETLANCRTPPRRLRPPSDWKWQKQSHMADFLPGDLAAKALPQVEQILLARWERSQDPNRPRRSSNKHRNSEYILTGLLVAKQDGEPLTGVLCGKVGKKVRKYRHRRGNRAYRRGSIFNNYIRAAELEDAVLALIAEVVADAPSLRELVLAAILATEPEADGEQNLSALRTERERLAQRVRLITRTLTEEHLADAQAELDAMAAQRRDLDRQISQLEQRSGFAAEDPEALADRIVARLAERSLNLSDISGEAKRDLIEAYVERIEVDMATKDADVSLRLPDWAMQGQFGMRLALSSRSQTGADTPPRLVVRLAIADCRYVRRASEVCYDCRRRKAA